MAVRFMPFPTLTLSALSVALMIACGGGETSADATPLTNQAATQHSANASAVGADASSALDATLLTATQLVPGTASGLRAGRKQALAASAGLACAGGGSATMTISGANALEELNGQLDAGEVYQIAFIDCRGATSQAVLNGGVTLSVVSAGAGTATVTLSTTTLTATLPRGVVSFIGGASVQRSVVASGATSNVSTHITSGGLAVTTHFNGRVGNFNLSGVDLTRQAVYAAGVLQSAVYSGTHTLSGTSAGEPFEYTMASAGGATFNGNGVPTQGAWVVTLPHQLVRIELANASVTISVDEGKDGSIERSFSIPLALFGEAVG